MSELSPDVELPATIGAQLSEVARRAPDSIALLAPAREALTYCRLRAQLASVADWLGAAGYGYPARIALALPSGPELAVALLAVSSRATCAPLNPELEEATLVRLLSAMHIDAVIVPAGEAVAAANAAQRLGIQVIELEVLREDPAGCFSLWPIAEAQRGPGASTEPGAHDVAMLMHTSGTTATPKVVPLTHHRLIESARARIALYALGPRDRCLLGMPLFTAAGVRRGLLLPLFAGGSLLCPGRFEAAQFVDLLEQSGATYYTAPAAAQSAILHELERRQRPLRHTLRFAETSGAPMPVAARRQLQARLGVPVVIGYGITETGSIAQTPLPPVETPDGSVGLPTRMEIRICGEAGREAGPGQIGEILVRGPEVFDGYENDPRATRAAFADGWFRTGDLGWLDRNGFLFLAGRVKDIVNRGGNKVAPGDVETVLATHPAVAECVAFALPHPTLGEDLAAAVVLRTAVSEHELREFARGRLVAFKVPSRVFVLPEIPKAALGKPKRGDLARIATELLDKEFVAPHGPTEQRLAAIFGELLQLDRIGACDSFLLLGGDSLRGARLLARVQAEFGVPIRLDELFRTPTIAGLAQRIDAGRAQSPEQLREGL